MLQSKYVASAHDVYLAAILVAGTFSPTTWVALMCWVALGVGAGMTFLQERAERKVEQKIADMIRAQVRKGAA